MSLTGRVECPELTALLGDKGRGFLPRCVAALVQALPVEEIWLFGSCARGEAAADSDVDLMVVLADDHGLPRPNLAAFKVVASIRNHPPADVIAITKSQWEYERAHPFGVYGDIAVHGVRIYGRQPARPASLV
jgi:hypothetical protein